MISLDLGLVIGLIIMLLSLFPSVVLLLQYQRYRIRESLMLAGFFFIGALTLILHTLAVVIDSLLLIKLTYIGFNFTYFFLFVYAVMLKWDFRVDTNKPPKAVWYLGVIWFLLLNFTILFWTRFPQPDNTFFFFLKIPRVNRVFSIPNGAGFQINDFILYGTHFDFLSLLFSLFVQALLLVNYVKLELIQPTKRTIRARKLWLIAFSFGVTFSILSLPYVNASEYVARFFTFIGVIIVIYISIWIPEGLLLSKTQILRATKLYEIIRKSGQTELKQEPKETSEYLFNYLLDVQKILKDSDSTKKITQKP